MPLRKLATLACLLCSLLLGGCTEQPQAALEAAVQQLQDSLEGKRTATLMELLHPDFRAQQQHDRDWARRTAALMFLRHRNVGVLALGQRSWIDPTYPDRGHTEAQVALTGAEGLLPQQAAHYSVRLEWWREGDDWRLARLDWD
ncbi:hypothetical protein N8H22_12150 [Stutzerimonas stutzeri]|uniref:hypothetical protein n=1 Tax=Stutzerimonas sp. S1 TaxID=3030652 RepID=UPI0022254495|nr:hypothetical protein [Stutzerimonas sp. S1]MCW3149347.1 hypothetical protein [Stutzerimonas sp. S1]